MNKSVKSYILGALFCFLTDSKFTPSNSFKYSLIYFIEVINSICPPRDENLLSSLNLL